MKKRKITKKMRLKIISFYVITCQKYKALQKGLATVMEEITQYLS